MFGCFNITPAGIKILGHSCKQLQTLNIGQCHKVKVIHIISCFNVNQVTLTPCDVPILCKTIEQCCFLLLFVLNIVFPKILSEPLNIFKMIYLEAQRARVASIYSDFV